MQGGFLKKSATILLYVACMSVLSACTKEKAPVEIYSGFKGNAFSSDKKADVENFRLLDHLGVSHELYRYGDSKAVVIVAQSNGCPIIRKSFGKLEELKSRFAPKGVEFLMINPNSQDNRRSILEETSAYKSTIPVLLDPTQLITESLHITRAAEVILLDTKTWKILYRGAIDDQFGYGTTKPRVGSAFLEQAIDGFLAGTKIDPKETTAKGCLISFSSAEKISYEKTVAPILQKNCLTCHAPGRTSPTLDSYESVKGWSAMIRETLRTELMPPNSIDTEVGHIEPNFMIPPEEKRKLVKWIEAGSVHDGKTDPLKTPFYRKNEFMGKPASKPALTLTADKLEKVPASGFLGYRYIQLGGPVPRDLWADGAELESKLKKQIHHASIFFTKRPLEYYLAKYRESSRLKETDPSEMRFGQIIYDEDEDNPDLSMVLVWAPGRPAVHRPLPGTGMFLRKGSYVLLQAHYEASGKEEGDEPRVHFYEAPKNKALHAVKVKMIGLFQFSIPPGARNFQLDHETSPIKEDMVLTAIFPHMHLRNQSSKLWAKYPDGKRELIYSISFYDFNWQLAYRLKKPMFFPKGTRFIMTGIYDNSRMNPYNPNPEAEVKFGGNSELNEMFLVNLGYYVPGKAEGAMRSSQAN